ncbi:prolipoprotein diacylglyceryl transferase [Algoriphagus sp. D3-2-R+10]|uniref:prolipoprotein diacylglyceryl transferase n=1 Tax=Algoriphagus aurantiacus TaxID=3103948 RepID=UPI002B37212A|nr:prolipoprotein diacylglyceryl transferase [Algoriphagus sp. D3-2-R+10]MEB2775052.1 prolipoprotein diacylglyceryl transferase [Algoriphagus sp. D3-2-R+10]
MILLYINWSQNGSLLDLGFYDIRIYSLLFGLGFVLGFFLLQRQFRSESVPEEKLDKLLVFVVIGTVIGARLGYCLFYEFEYYFKNPLEILIPVRFSPEFEVTGFKGLASHGGAIGILVSVMLFSWKQKINIYWVLDKLALVVPLACGFIRLGNLFNSEMIGNPSTVPWAFVFQQIDSIPRHPGQLYEALAYFSIFLFLNFYAGKVQKEKGFLFGLFLVLSCTARFLLEFFKIDQVGFESSMVLNMGQLLSLPFIIAGLILMFMRNRIVVKAIS